MTAIWQTQPTNFFDENGLLASGAKAYFYYAGTSTPLTVFQDSTLSVPHAIPVVANSLGVFAPIYLNYVDYRVRILSANNTELYNADYISNPAPPVASVDNGRIVTGMPFWWLSSIAPDGYVRMNGRTIGPTGSAATELANDTTEALFTHLYGLSDSIATVSGGRGASAAADWAANKTIVVPTMQGFLPGGVEGMGATAENRIQSIGICDVTNSSADIIVADTTGLTIGMTVIISEVDSGTIIDIDPVTLTVTLSAPYSGTTDTDISYRASMFSDAQQIGASGGLPFYAQTLAELAAHDHDVTDPGHAHDLRVNIRQVDGASSEGDGTVWTSSSFVSGYIQSNTTGLTVDSKGAGVASSLIQPTRLGTWIIKL